MVSFIEYAFILTLVFQDSFQYVIRVFVCMYSAYSLHDVVNYFAISSDSTGNQKSIKYITGFSCTGNKISVDPYNGVTLMTTTNSLFYESKLIK